MTLDHSIPNFNCSSQYNEEDANKPDDPEAQIPQCYALQFIDKWTGIGNHEHNDVSLLLTSSDDYIHLWELVEEEEEWNPGTCIIIGSDNKSPQSPKTKICLKKRLSFLFTDMNSENGGVITDFTPNNQSHKAPKASSLPAIDENGNADDGNNNNNSSAYAFGGVRNPENQVFVFDAALTNNENIKDKTGSLFAVALSDGTCRLVNARGVCVAILQLPGCDAHLTALSWDSRGERLSTCVATGHVILWGISAEIGGTDVVPSCLAILDGGHDSGRPLFGALYCGGKNEVRFS